VDDKNFEISKFRDEKGYERLQEKGWKEIKE
jgi:hypothetical protein